MKSTRGGIIALGCAVAVLALVIRAWSPGATPDPRRTREAGVGAAGGGSSDERAAGGAPAGTRARGAGGTGGNQGFGAAGPSRPGGRTAGDQGGGGRRPLAPATGGVQSGAVQRGGGPAADAAGTGIGDLARRDGSTDALKDRLNHHDLPPAGHPDTADATDETEPEPISDVAYDGGADHVFDTSSRAEITDVGTITGNAGTIAFWIEPQWSRDSPEGASLVQLGDGALQIVKDGNLLRFEYTDSRGMQYGGSTDIGEWQNGDWRHVAGAWNAGTLSLYIDGGQVFLNHGPGAPNLQSDTKLYVGSALPNGAAAAPGQLSYLTVLNHDVSGDEVRQMFESGGPPGQ